VGIEERLSDAPRSGSPGIFSAEQITQIMAGVMAQILRLKQMAISLGFVRYSMWIR
jgi:hypothetical protein